MVVKNKQELMNILWGEDGQEWQSKEISTSPYKHDMTQNIFVCTNPANGKIYRGSYLSSYNEGIIEWEFPITLEEVEPYEVTVTKYRKV